MYKCPQCSRYGISWDSRAKVLICYYIDYNYVIRISGQRGEPGRPAILDSIREEMNE